MKRIFTIVLISAFSFAAFAKKVKFSVDMDTITINVNGVHITGDFQDEAGFAADWDPGTTGMTQDLSDPSIYSIVVDIPAFRYYEFVFVNGIFGYEMEFIPLQSRVGGPSFNGNRWIYIDSLSNDTQLVAPIIYSTNAPAGKYLLRLKVDAMNLLPNSKGIHLVGDFQGWDTTATFMFGLNGFVHEYITYVDTGMPTFQHEYKFFNGNMLGDQESVPVACSNVNGNRGVYVSSDTVMAVVCFGSCTSCPGSSIAEINEQQIKVYPNPSKGEFHVQSSMFSVAQIKIYDVLGALVLEKTLNDKPGTLNIVVPGIYFLKIESDGQAFSEKIVVE